MEWKWSGARVFRCVHERITVLKRSQGWMDGAGIKDNPRIRRGETVVWPLERGREAMEVGITNTAKHTNTRIYREEGGGRKEEEEVNGVSI